MPILVKACRTDSIDGSNYGVLVNDGPSVLDVVLFNNNFPMGLLDISHFVLTLSNIVLTLNGHILVTLSLET